MARTTPIDKSDPNTKKRTCLKCSKLFWSVWSGHRICDKCKPKFLYRDNGLGDHSLGEVKRR
jgi:hypothetical protein